MDAGVTVTFFDEDIKIIRSVRNYLNCYKNSAECEMFELPADAKYVRVCYSTEYDDPCSDCNVATSDEDEDDDEEDDDEEDDE